MPLKKIYKTFNCINCQGKPSSHNHCSFCLFSKHVDIIPGDRKSKCLAKMAPIGLTFKNLKIDKYGRPKRGELMLIHLCLKCSNLRINKTSGEDNIEQIKSVFESSKNMDLTLRERLEKENIYLLNKTDKVELNNQLYGK